VSPLEEIAFGLTAGTALVFWLLALPWMAVRLNNDARERDRLEADVAGLRKQIYDQETLIRTAANAAGLEWVPSQPEGWRKRT
jgi:hypothetical protein